jgi:hypothetical protein
MRGEYKFVIAVVILCIVVISTAYYIDSRKNTGPTADPMEDVGSQEYYEKEILKMQRDSMIRENNYISQVMTLSYNNLKLCNEQNDILTKEVAHWKLIAETEHEAVEMLAAILKQKQTSKNLSK